MECPPTFSTTNEVNGIIAGGPSAFVKAKEGAEDHEMMVKEKSWRLESVIKML